MYPLPTHTSTQSLERRKTAGEGSKDWILSFLKEVKMSGQVFKLRLPL